MIHVNLLSHFKFICSISVMNTNLMIVFITEEGIIGLIDSVGQEADKSFTAFRPEKGCSAS